MSKEAQLLEAFLFLKGEPISQFKAAEVIGIEKRKISEVVNELKSFLENNSGLTLLIVEEKIQLVTKSEFSKVLDGILKEEIKNDQLTPAALETLTIISYAGPLEKSKIDYLRGVNSGYILRNLLVRGLIERKYISEKRIYIYNISSFFLKHLGLEAINLLPEYEKFKQLIESFLNQNNEQ